PAPSDRGAGPGHCRGLPAMDRRQRGAVLLRGDGRRNPHLLKAMMLSVPLPVALACRATISSADLRGAFARIDRPTLIVHGDKDASAPLALTGAKTAKLIRSSKLNVYAGAPHAIVLTHRERLMADVLGFLGA